MKLDEIWYKRDNLNKLATNIFSNYIMPIYLADYRQVPIQFGSAFLLNSKNKNYLITAAHSLIPEKGSDYERHVPCILVGKEKKPFFIKDFAYSLPENEELNKYDIAAARLDDRIISQILLSNDAHINVVSSDKVMPGLPRERNLFCFLGYQNSKNKSLPSGEFKAPKSTAYLNGSPNKELYESAKISPQNHLLVDFPTESDREGRMPGIPNGLSGGPVFAFGAKDSWENVEYGLAGVATGYLPVQNILKATDIGMVNVLISKYDDVAHKGKHGIMLE